MKFDSEREWKLAFNYYKDNKFYGFISLVAKSIVMNMGDFLKSTDDLLLQEHLGIDRKSTVALLKIAHVESDQDHYENKVNKIKNRSAQRIWRHHLQCMSLYSSLQQMYFLMHGSWNVIRHQVLSKHENKRYDDHKKLFITESLRDQVVSITHEVCQKYCYNIMIRIQKCRSVFYWKLPEQVHRDMEKNKSYYFIFSGYYGPIQHRSATLKSKFELAKKISEGVL